MPRGRLSFTATSLRHNSAINTALSELTFRDTAWPLFGFEILSRRARCSMAARARATPSAAAHRRLLARAASCRSTGLIIGGCREICYRGWRSAMITRRWSVLIMPGNITACLGRKCPYKTPLMHDDVGQTSA